MHYAISHSHAVPRVILKSNLPFHKVICIVMKLEKASLQLQNKTYMHALKYICDNLTHAEYLTFASLLEINKGKI